MKGHKGPSRAQLQSRIDRLEGLVAHLKTRLKPDPLRRPGEHWYEITAYFDADGIQPLPVDPQAGRAFIMPGMIQDMTIVEVSRDYERQEELEAWLTKQLGVAPLIITDDVRFVRLSTPSPELERELDAGAMKEETDADEDLLSARSGS